MTTVYPRFEDYAPPVASSFIAEHNNDVAPVTGGNTTIYLVPDSFYDVDGGSIDAIPADAGLELLDIEGVPGAKQFQATEDGVWAVTGGFLFNEDATGVAFPELSRTPDGVGNMANPSRLDLSIDTNRRVGISQTVALTKGHAFALGVDIGDLTADPWTPGFYGIFRVIRLG